MIATEPYLAETGAGCYWLHVVTNCNAELKLQRIKAPAAYDWRPVQKVEHHTMASEKLGE